MKQEKWDNRPMREIFRRAGVALVLACGIAIASAAALAQDPAAAAGSGDPLDLVKQARKLNSEGKQDGALALYRQALERAPDLFDAHLGAGIVLDLQGNYKDARKHLARAIELAPDGSRNLALSTMAVSYAFERDAAGASRFYRQVFDRQESTQDLGGAAETANALGRIYLESGDFDNALKWYQTGYETSRRQPKLTEDQIDLWNMRWAHAQARIAARKGNVDEARKQTAAVKALLDKGTNADQQIQYPYLAGYVALYSKDYQTAIMELQKADQRDPFILVLLAQAYEKAGDAVKAREYYTQVLASNAHSTNNAFARPLARKKAPPTH
jgi:tetratricopeptide (TPR) repeat protein